MMNRGKNEDVKADKENKHKKCNNFFKCIFSSFLGWKQAVPKIINCGMCPAHLSETFNYRVELDAGEINGLM